MTDEHSSEPERTSRAPIPWAKPNFWENEERYVADALASTWISGGPFVDRFEEALARELDAPFVVAVSNGTTAIHLAYLALGLGPGDEIIVPGFCFQAAANVASLMGATPVFAEIRPDTWCLDPCDLESRISERTKLIVPVHTYGSVCDMDAIRTVADAAGVPVLEDAAEAFASSFGGRMAGTMGLMGTLSFQATKTITTGEGGAVLTSSRELRDRMHLFRSHGMAEKRYWHEVHGHNFRLTNFQAALGCAQLEHLDQIVRERARVKARYEMHLADAAGLEMQTVPEAVDSVLWAMAVRLDPDAFPQGRDEVMDQLKAKAIETRVGFYAASEIPLYGCGPLPVCEAVSGSLISLPTFPTLTNDEIDFICDQLLRLRA